MSTEQAKEAVNQTVSPRYSVHHHRGAASFIAAAGYAVAVALTGGPVTLLAGLFVPLSLGTESAFRAARPGPMSTRADALATGFGILVGMVATGVVVFAAGAVGI